MDSTVRGEASETDDETQLDIGLPKIPVLASEIKGEATESESDEEIFEKPLNRSNDHVHARSILQQNNILQQKLISSNLDVVKRLRSIARDYVSSTSKTLISCDQLIRNQLISMQNILSSVKASNENTRQLQEKMGALFPNNFIPHIKVEPQNSSSNSHA